MFMYVCDCVCAYVYVRVCVLFVSLCVCVCMRLCVFVLTCVCLYLFVHHISQPLGSTLPHPDLTRPPPHLYPLPSLQQQAACACVGWPCMLEVILIAVRNNVP